MIFYDRLLVIVLFVEVTFTALCMYISIGQTEVIAINKDFKSTLFCRKVMKNMELAVQVQHSILQSTQYTIRREEV